MKVVVCLAIALLVSVVVGDTLCQHHNDCANSGNGLFCQQVNTANPPTFQCRQCGSTCDCPTDQFCVTDYVSGFWTQDLVGTCQPYNIRGVVGQQCQGSITSNNVMRGSTDILFCGLPTAWNTITTSATAVAWQGACHYGVCQVCDDGAQMCGYNQRVCINGMWQPVWFSDNTVRTVPSNATASAAAATAVVLVAIALIYAVVRGCRFAMVRNQHEQQHLLPATQPAV